MNPPPGIEQHPIVTGMRFGRLVVISGEARRGNKRPAWICRCDCGQVTRAFTYNIKNGHTKSCGCLKVDVTKAAKTTHGARRSEEYGIWTGILTRCYNKNCRAYDRYGGRGIVVCDRWRHDFAAFLADMGHRPSPRHSIDRYPDNNGNYEPGNCRWATVEQQNRNTKKNINLSEEQVRQIRMDSRPQLAIAETYGIERHYVSMIKRRKVRADVD